MMMLHNNSERQLVTTENLAWTQTCPPRSLQAWPPFLRAASSDNNGGDDDSDVTMMITPTMTMA